MQITTKDSSLPQSDHDGFEYANQVHFDENGNKLDRVYGFVEESKIIVSVSAAAVNSIAK